MLNAASADFQEMRARVEITDNVAQAGSVQINNVNLPGIPGMFDSMTDTQIARSSIVIQSAFS